MNLFPTIRFQRPRLAKGLRREEVLGLKWTSFDLTNKKMRIVHTVTKGTKVNRLNSAKTESSIRSFPLTTSQVILLRRMKKQEEENRKLFGNTYFFNDYVFKHEDGSLYSPDYPTKAFGKVLKKIPELPQGVTLHGLRKSCASVLVHDNKDIKSIQQWLGHKDEETTIKIYAKVKEKEAKNDISEHLSDIIPIKDYGDDN